MKFTLETIGEEFLNVQHESEEGLQQEKPLSPDYSFQTDLKNCEPILQAHNSAQNSDVKD